MEEEKAKLAARYYHGKTGSTNIARLNPRLPTLFLTKSIIDLFSHRVIAHAASLKNSTHLITSTFKKAFKLREQLQWLTFHSDQVAQYTTNTFRKLLRMNKAAQSFSNPDKPHDNAVAYAFFATMKKEELYRTNDKSESEPRSSIDEYFPFYNESGSYSTLHG